MADSLPNGKTIDQLDKELQKFLDDNGAEIGYELVFPIYRIIPDEVKLALSVIAKHSMKVLITLSPKKK